MSPQDGGICKPISDQPTKPLPELQALGSSAGAGNAPPAPPHRLVAVPGYGGRRGLQLREDAARALLLMQDAARAAGVQEPLLRPVSCLRSKALQRQLFEQAVARYGSPEVARRWVAAPGSSSHETARVADLWLGPGTCEVSQIAGLVKTDAYAWLKAHAGDYRFYPYEAEPWHWEFGHPHDPTGVTYRAEIAQGIAQGWLLP